MTGFYDGPMAMVSGIRGLEGGIWSKNENGRWGYSYNGNIPRNQWAYIYISSLNSSHWYYFDELGLMVVGWWKMADGSWFHLHVTDDALIGALDYGWFFETEDRRWYYLDPLSGRMHTGWVQVDKKWYCFNEAVPENTWDFNAAIRRWVFGNRDDMPLGALYLSGKTPDGHTVDENGVSADYNGKGGNIAGNMQPGFPTATPSNFLNGMPNFKNGVWEEKRTTAAGTEYTAVGGSF